MHDTIKELGGSSLFRAARARRLLAGAAAEGKATEDDLVAVLHDHLGYPMSICRHLDEEDDPLQRAQSVYSVLIDLDARRMAVACGPPCEHEYAWLDPPALGGGCGQDQ